MAIYIHKFAILVSGEIIGCNVCNNYRETIDT